MEIGDRIKHRRELIGMSQEELANRVGYKSRSSINKIELDGRGLPQSKIAAFAKALETTPAYLMGWKDAENKLIAERFNKIVNQKGLSLHDIANRSNTSLSFVKHVASGNADTETQDMAKISSVLGVSYFYLMGWISEEEAIQEEALLHANTLEDARIGLSALGADYEKVFLLYHSMNDIGKHKALDNLKDLSKLYPTSNNLLNAANQRTDINLPTNTDISDDDIMDAEDF